jgi:hypothetical protein
MSGTNDLRFVRHVVARLEAVGIRTWLFGGWAAELLGLRLPRPHHDVDLLYPAESFEAVEVNGIMVELPLLQGPEDGPFTDFWGVKRYEWPSNVLGIQAGGLRVASAMSLIDYQDTRQDLLPSVDGKQVSSEEWLEHQNTSD